MPISATEQLERSLEDIKLEEKDRLERCVFKVIELLGDPVNPDQLRCYFAFNQGDRTTVEAYAFRYSDDPYYSCLNYLMGALAGGSRSLTVLREAALKASDNDQRNRFRGYCADMDLILNGDQEIFS